MQPAIIKVQNIGAERKWIPVIGNIQRLKWNVHRDFPKWADCYIVLSGQFENPRCMSGKRILILDSDEWKPDGAWNAIYRDLVTHFYDEIIDCTGMTFKDTAEKVVEVAEKWKANQPRA